MGVNLEAMIGESNRPHGLAEAPTNECMKVHAVVSHVTPMQHIDH